MQYLVQIARSVRSLLLGSQSDPVLLKHEPTQQFLGVDTGWTSHPELARRLSSEQAETFLARYACEPDAWLVLSAPQVDDQAAA